MSRLAAELARLSPELDEAGIALHPAAEDQLRLLESVTRLISRSNREWRRSPRRQGDGD